MLSRDYQLLNFLVHVFSLGLATYFYLHAVTTMHHVPHTRLGPRCTYHDRVQVMEMMHYFITLVITINQNLLEITGFW